MKFSLKATLFCFSSLAFFNASAQDAVDNFLSENLKDSEKLVKAYISPAMNAFSVGLNQGWYNTAKPHKIAGFDLTFTANAMMIPSSEFWFKPDQVLGSESQIKFDDGSPDAPKAPTIFGPGGSEHVPIFYTEDEFGNRLTFEGPSGEIDLKGDVGMNAVPLPMLHLGFGLPKGTDVKVRFIPQINLGDDSHIKMYGVGIMHDVKQWIPGIKSMPFDLSGFVGYTKMEVQVGMDEDNPDQKMQLQMNALTIQGVISKKISVLTLYGGAGYNVAKSSLAMRGTYEIEETGQTVEDPFDMKFSASGVRMTGGFRLKLAIFTLHADYTLQKYSCITAGFGFSVR